MDNLLIVLVSGLKNDEQRLFVIERLLVQRATGHEIFYSALFWAGGLDIRINDMESKSIIQQG